MDKDFLLWVLPVATGIAVFFLKDLFKNNATQKDIELQNKQTIQNTEDIGELKELNKKRVTDMDLQLIKLEIKQQGQRIAMSNNQYTSLSKKFEENNKFIQDNFVTKEMFEFQMEILTKQNANIDKKQDCILNKLDNLK